MAKVKGSDGVVKIGAATVAGVRSFTLDESMTPIDDSDLNTTELTYVAGDITRTASVECFWDKSDTTGQEVLVIGAEVTLVLAPEGADVGSRTQSMTAFVTGVSQANEKQNMVTKNVTFQVSGLVTVA
jgi:hypothetical protein